LFLDEASVRAGNKFVSDRQEFRFDDNGVDERRVVDEGDLVGVNAVWPAK